MTTQQALFAATILGMRKAMARRDDASESDDSTSRPTNRGNKLKRKARHVQEGKLDVPDGRHVYRRKIDHAGYKRYIISRNPPRFDADGDEVDEEDYEEQGDASPLVDDPYEDIKLENLLAPLESAAELPDHPSLSVAHKSKAITEMAQNACDMVHRENASLWRMKQLFTKFRGDETWTPCGMFETGHDLALFGQFRPDSIDQAVVENDVEQHTIVWERTTNTTSATENEIAGAEPLPRASADRALPDLVGIGAQMEHGAVMQITESTIISNSESGGVTAVHTGVESANVAAEDVKNGLLQNDATPVDSANIGVAETGNTSAEQQTMQTQPRLLDQVPQPQEALVPTTEEGGPDVFMGNASDKDQEAQDEEESSSGRASHRMTTRARANASTPRPLSVSPAPSSTPTVHPIFQVPSRAQPDHNFGLETREADDLRKLLLLYVQKQEEVVRGARQLYEGLLRADRMRKEILRWCKADGHVGEMSDGEDWYDKEEWGLDEDLVKGKEEEEDEVNAPGKKTRQRRQN